MAMSVVVGEQLSVGSEFQFEAIVEFHLIAIVLLVDFDDGSTIIVGFHKVGDRGRDRCSS